MAKRHSLQPDEIPLVLADLHKRCKRYTQPWVQLVVFRLAAGCGLRRKEIAGLDMQDVCVTGPQPSITVRPSVTKGRKGKRKSRRVPLSLDEGTLADLTAWKERREAMGAGPTDPFLCGLFEDEGHRFSPRYIDRRWRTAIRALGPERQREVSVHCGRHTFGSLVVNKYGPVKGMILAMEWMGHTNMSTTALYLHALGDIEMGGLMSPTTGEVRANV